jgi:uncharacterized membrane protein
MSAHTKNVGALRDLHGWTEQRIEQVIGRLLQIGVVVATATVLIGGVTLLAQHGRTTPDYRVFLGTDAALQSVGSILHGLLTMDARAIVQLGIVLLIATPVLRVAFMLGAFAAQRDRLYVLLSAVVLALLLYGLFGAG